MLSIAHEEVYVTATQVTSDIGLIDNQYYWIRPSERFEMIGVGALLRTSGAWGQDPAKSTSVFFCYVGSQIGARLAGLAEAYFMGFSLALLSFRFPTDHISSKLFNYGRRLKQGED